MKFKKPLWVAVVASLAILGVIFTSSKRDSVSEGISSPEHRSANEAKPCDCYSCVSSPIPRAGEAIRPENPHNYDDALLAVARRLQADTIELRRIPLGYSLDETVTFSLGGETVTLNRDNMRSENFAILIQGSTGELTEIPAGPIRTYVGDIEGRPNATVGAYLGVDGIIARIADPLERDQLIDPLTEDEVAALDHTIPGEGILHAFYIPVSGTDVEAEHIPSTFDEDGNEMAAMATGGGSYTPTAADVANPIVPNVTVKEAEVGFDVAYSFYQGRHSSDTSKVMDTLEAFLVSTLNLVTTRDTLVKHVMGKVVIRTNKSQDPYDGKSKHTEILPQFRGIWNGSNSPSSTHALAHLAMNQSIGVTGFAYVGTIGAVSRYSIATSRSGMGFWRNGTRHEIGHNWSLRHGDGCKQDPTPNNGPTDSGIICGGFHERANTVEVNKILNHRNSRAPGVLKDIGPYTAANLPPYCRRNNFTVTQGGGNKTVDVLADDFDSNNDNFTISRFTIDTVTTNQTPPVPVTTPLGGTVIRSIGTGPNGRDRIIYTPPSGRSGNDIFHYWAKDTGGKQAWGVINVKVNGNSSITVDLSKTKYDYDFGPVGSPVQNGWTAITPETKGDITWSASVGARDRGAGGGVNNINRDLVQTSTAVTLSHKISNGIWGVVMNMGDKSYRHDNMQVSAEGGQVVKSNITAEKGTFPYVTFDVTVTDGRLDIEFSDQGGSDSNWVLTRMTLQRKGDLPPSPVPVTNIAQGKPSNQSSVGYGGIAGRATDGNTNGAYRGGSVTHTNREAQAWWEIDLGSVSTIAQVKLWNRTDCCRDRLSNFYVLVSDVPFNSKNLNATLSQSGVGDYKFDGTAGSPSTINVNRTGRYVRVQLVETNFLSLAEVEILGALGASASRITPPSELTQLEFRHSQKCVDNKAGNVNGATYHQWSCGVHLNRNFTFENRGDGWWGIRSEKSGRCLDVDGGSTADGGKLHQWACNNGNINQSWRIQNMGGGWFQLESRRSGKCVDVKDGNLEDRGIILQKNCDPGKRSQHLKFR